MLEIFQHIPLQKIPLKIISNQPNLQLTSVVSSHLLEEVHFWLKKNIGGQQIEFHYNPIFGKGEYKVIYINVML